MDYTVLKHLHILFAAASICGFVIRGLLALRQSDILSRRWIKVTPHINDTLLLVTAIALAVQASYSPWHNPWLAAKIILLLVYIAIGFYVLRFARSYHGRLMAFILAILVFAGIVFIAISKTVPFIPSD